MLIKPICCFNGYAGHRRWAMNVLSLVIKSHGLESTSPFFLSVKQQIRTRNDTLVKFEDNDANDSSFSALLITIMTLLYRNPW